jgi:hypothetical protein
VIGSCFLSRLACTMTFLLYASCRSWGDRYAQLLIEMESCKLLASAGLEHWSSQSQPPKWLGLQAWATSAQGNKVLFYFKEPSASSSFWESNPGPHTCYTDTLPHLIHTPGQREPSVLSISVLQKNLT